MLLYVLTQRTLRRLFLSARRHQCRGTLNEVDVIPLNCLSVLRREGLSDRVLMTAFCPHHVGEMRTTAKLIEPLLITHHDFAYEQPA